MDADSVSLSWHEAAMASHVGWMRQLASIRAGLIPGAGYTGEGWSEHCEGACGECALAKFLCLYWDGSVNTFRQRGDLPGLEVRTRSRHDYELIVRPNDDDAARFVLLTGRCPTYRVRGWIVGKDAKRDEWIQTHGGRPAAYFVPARALRPMSELEQE